jgi:predicted PurR-regulated permease PerM
MQDKLNNISISSGTIFRFFAILAGIVAAYYLFDVILVVVVAVILASAIDPLVRRLKHYGVHRIVGAVTVYLLISAAIVALMVFFMPILLNELTGFVNELPKTISIGDLWAPLGDSTPGIAEKSFSVSELLNDLRQFINIGDGGSGLLKTATAFFGGFLSFIMIVVISFYLSVQEDGVGDFLRLITPISKHNYITNLWRRSQRKIAFWLQGQIVLGLIMGLLVYIILKVVGVEHALVFALISALFEIIPIFGPIIASLPPIFVTFTDMGLGSGVILVALYLIIYQLENQFFYPLVVKKIVGVSPIVVILALVIGYKLAGVLGMIISVPLSAVFMEYINDLEKEKKHAHENPNTPLPPV